MLIREFRYQPKSITDFYKDKLNLSDEESEIWDLAMRDKSIEEISHRLMLSTSTVNRKLKSIRLKIREVI